MANWEFPCEFALWVSSLAGPLHGRLSWRLMPLMIGLLFAQGRCTVSSWLRAAGLGDDFRAYYYFLGSLGRKVDSVAVRLLWLLRERLVTGDRILLAIDDSPTKRYGPMVEGAGLHHNPTPGPADAKFLYGHVWVTLAWIVRHPNWGSIALPLLAKLYVRAKDIAKIVPWYNWTFQTKLQQAAELVDWAVCRLDWTGKPIWVVADGAYAKRPFLKRAPSDTTITQYSYLMTHSFTRVRNRLCSNGTSGSRMICGASPGFSPARQAAAAIHPACLPMTSRTKTLVDVRAMEATSSAASRVETATYLATEPKPGQVSVTGRSLSTVLGIPMQVIG